MITALDRSPSVFFCVIRQSLAMAYTAPFLVYVGTSCWRATMVSPFLSNRRIKPSSITSCFRGWYFTSVLVTDQTLQIYGGMGLMDELPIERFWRDARVERIWDGTSEIQRHIIARTLMRETGR